MPWKALSRGMAPHNLFLAATHDELGRDDKCVLLGAANGATDPDRTEGRCTRKSEERVLGAQCSSHSLECRSIEWPGRSSR